MLFGYVPAALAGFLFTAIPNWTGRLPKQGWPLAALLALWLAGRLAVAGAGGLPAPAVMAIDAGFLLALCVVIAVEIVAGRNWRNLKVLVPLLLLTGRTLAFHLEAMTRGTADIGRRLGFAVTIFLIMLIGGRIIPSFTRNWLARRGTGPMPAPFGRFDAVALAAAVVALGALDGAGRGSRRFPRRYSRPRSCTRRGSPAGRGSAASARAILLMLHLVLRLHPGGLRPRSRRALPAAGVHLLGIGAIGGMTLAVMMRAAMGHTGRALAAGRLLAAAFAGVALAAVLRSAAPDTVLGGVSGVLLAATLWTAAFAAFAGRVGPGSSRPTPGGGRRTEARSPQERADTGRTRRQPGASSRTSRKPR